MARLEVRNIVKSFKNRTVVKQVSFNVNSGEIVGLLGPNGASKTTSFRIAIGMLRPEAGMVLINGENVTNMPMFKRARKGIGYLAQEAVIFKKLTVFQNIFAILEARGLSRKLAKEKTRQLLREFGLQLLNKSRAGNLSGGERRRLEIARGLSTEPQIMLMDEPIAGVDPIAIAEIVKHIRNLKKKNIGILITEHQVKDVLPILDRAYIIHDGRVIFSGTPQEVVANNAVREYYLGEDFVLPEKVD
ncbi:MAG: LPS export ABC transporter ATP-binding protein [Planctomycetes bacterium]|nr:LPS export ABC transporter ATP-binding protein [Planctomycetota bacterium]